MYLVKKLWNPEIYQGKYKTKNYFEGWYFKVIDKHKQNAIAIIPGISLGDSINNSHSFVQVIDASNNISDYLKFDIAKFKYSKNSFDIWINDNYFNKEGITLNLNSQRTSVNGSLKFKDIVSFPKTLICPGIMGPFSFIPFMECYHGIVNMHHNIIGMLNINGKDIDFTNGYGYIEKDWGHCFPESWIWLQSNHFDKCNASIMFSIAKIPWLHRYFIGFISFLYIDNKLYKFATYTNSKITKLLINNLDLDIELVNRNYKLSIVLEGSDGATLKAPKNGMMTREIIESISANANVKLFDNNKVIFDGHATNTGLEIVGNISNYYNFNE